MSERDVYETAKARLRWWKLSNLCRRAGHFWRELDEPGVFKCRLCRSILFTESSSSEAIYHVLGGHSSTCNYWISTATNNTSCSCGRQK